MKYLLLLSIFIYSSLNAQFTNTVVSISGVVKDSEHKNISGWVIVSDADGKTVNRARCNGKYFITGLKPGQTYSITVDAKGYFENNYDLVVPNTDKYSELSKDFEMKEMEVGAQLAFKVIPFDLRHSKLRPGSDLFLEEYLSILRSNPRGNFSIVVYPESESNTNISQQRAEELKKYFEENRVRAEIVIDAKGNFDPQNPPPKGKQAKGKRYKGSIYLVVNNI